ncbi:MAG TPA: ATP-dependent DNA helicase RecQ [Gemmatimonadaceae bacterium]
MSQPTMADARAVLLRHFGYPDFRDPQRPAIEAVLGGRDAVIVLPTGGGKSICFQVPALCFDGLTVVISPLISLMADQVQALERRGIPATFLNSTLAAEESAARVARVREGIVRLLYVAPERLATGSMNELLSRTRIALLAVDEAHCVSEWGQDFRPSYLRIPAVRRLMGDPQTIALTATATPRVRRDVARLLELREPREIVGGFDRPNLSFRVERVDTDAVRHQRLVREVRAARDPVVVYAATRRQVEQVARLLVSSGVRAVPYHAGLTADRRARAQDAFMTGQSRVIVATNAFGMGIDKPDVRLVLHYLHSGSLEDYYQEAGRAGRDGGKSRCILLFNPGDRRIHDRMRDGSRIQGDQLRHVWQRLATLSGGRRAVPLDPRSIGGSLPDEIVEGSLRVFEERGLLRDLQRPDTVRLRLLASPLRLACERPALSPDARLVLDAIVGSSGDEPGFCTLAVSRLGISQRRMDEAISELQSRQLAYGDRVIARAVLDSDLRSRARLERLIHQLKTRHDVERAKLNSMVSYATALTCRRRFILSYFGDEAKGAAVCDDCDICTPQG